MIYDRALFHGMKLSGAGVDLASQVPAYAVPLLIVDVLCDGDLKLHNILRKHDKNGSPAL
jgi:hypothetical protein